MEIGAPAVNIHCGPREDQKIYLINRVLLLKCIRI
jgi:hypothetical protein